MKYFLIAFACMMIASFTSAQNKAFMTFKDTMHHNFGVVNEGDKAEHTFVFTNTGNVDLLISEVRTTCFCTATEWTKTTVKPKGTGTIKVDFDTKEKNGEYAKGVNVFSNAGESNLIIYITVKGKTAPPQPVIENKEEHNHDHHDHSGHDHK